VVRNKKEEKMRLKHVGLVCRSENNSDRFYENLLGLKKIGSKMVPGDLSRQIFNLNSEYKIVNYANDAIHFEIFIDAHRTYDDKRIEHICLEFEDLEAFLAKCQQMAVTILKIHRGDAVLTFIRDFDGNLFELKEKS